MPRRLILSGEQHWFQGIISFLTCPAVSPVPLVGIELPWLYAPQGPYGWDQVPAAATRLRKAKGIETYPEYPTAPAPKTLDNSSDDVVLPSPDQPVMGPSYTVHDNITSNVTAIGENTVESIKEDGASDVDVEGATDNAMGPNVGFWLTPDQQVTGSSYTLAHDNITSNATAIDNHAVEAVEEDGTSDVDVEGATDKAMGPNVGFWPKIRERAIRCFKRLDTLALQSMAYTLIDHPSSLGISAAASLSLEPQSNPEQKSYRVSSSSTSNGFSLPTGSSTSLADGHAPPNDTMSAAPTASASPSFRWLVLLYLIGSNAWSPYNTYLRVTQTDGS
ncbi:hypothetical protein F5141DRAFT_1062473 [Pisolithus sp. B1]|nr:hypothetical protein F5141DRAFT_1062473 [Pisolithus sp. B1]